MQVYWSYWGVLFATLLTWVFAVAAAADDAWLATADGVVPGSSFKSQCAGGAFGGNDEYEKACNLYTAARAFQYLATILVSFILVLVVVAAFMAAPATGKLGLAAGIALAVFSLFQLIAFSLMASFVKELNLFFEDHPYIIGVQKLKAGPTLGVAVMAWLFGMAGAVVVLLLRARATSGQAGPIKRFMSNSATV